MTQIHMGQSGSLNMHGHGQPLLHGGRAMALTHIYLCVQASVDTSSMNSYSHALEALCGLSQLSHQEWLQLNTIIATIWGDFIRHLI